MDSQNTYHLGAFKVKTESLADPSYLLAFDLCLRGEGWGLNLSEELDVFGGISRRFSSFHF